MPNVSNSEFNEAGQTDAGKGVEAGVSAVMAASAAASLATNSVLVAGMVGLLPKAQLYVPKAYSLADMDVVSAVSGNNDVAALKALVKAKKTKSNSAVAQTGVKARLKQMLPGSLLATQIAAQVQQAALTTAMSQKSYSVMDVQYNPKSIQISNSAGPLTRRPPSGDAAATQIQISDNIVKSRFTVELIFEDINVSDAFHFEGLSMNAEELMQTAASFAFNTFGDGYSVQKPCEGLLALLNFKKLKQVIFMWSDMFFHGELTSVDVSYEMFNKLGNPILAKVRLTIEQNDTAGTIHYASDDEQWDEAIDIAFGEAGTAAIKNLF